MLKMLTDVHKEIAFFLSLMPQTLDRLHSCKAKTSTTVSKSMMPYNDKPQNALPSLTLFSKMTDKMNLKLKISDAICLLLRANHTTMCFSLLLLFCHDL